MRLSGQNYADVLKDTLYISYLSRSFAILYLILLWLLLNAPLEQ